MITNLVSTLERWIRGKYMDAGTFSPAMIPLIPFVPVYVATRRVNQMLRTLRRRRLHKPVLSIGNLSLGGTGKTMFTAWLAKKLIDREIQPAILKRGEGQETGIVHGTDLSSCAKRFGDESALLSRKFPELTVSVDPNRHRAGSEVLKEHNPDCFLLDDGFQHRQLVRELDLVLVDSVEELDEWQLPAGPLREPRHALSRADIVSLHIPKQQLETQRETIRRRCRIRPDVPIICHSYRFESILRGQSDVTDAMRSKPLQLVTTLARPQRLIGLLKQEGFQIAQHIDLPDHSTIDPKQVFDCFDPEQTLVTEKEWTKLPQRLRDRTGRIQSEFRVNGGKRVIRECVETIRTDS